MRPATQAVLDLVGSRIDLQFGTLPPSIPLMEKVNLGLLWRMPGHRLLLRENGEFRNNPHRPKWRRMSGARSARADGISHRSATSVLPVDKKWGRKHRRARKNPAEAGPQVIPWIPVGS